MKGINLNIIELFSGIGAPKKALNDLKIKNKTLFISEINENAINAYNSIFNNKFVKNIGNISQFNRKEVKNYKNKCDILFSGSPCQDFSQGGNNLGGKKQSNTRSSLLWKSVEIIKIVKPKIVIFENVKNLIHKKHSNIVNEYFEELKGANYYSAKPIILNAKNFNIPQNRDRVFIVSFLSKEKCDKFNEINWEKKYKKGPNLKKFLKIINFKNRELEKQKIEFRRWKNFSTWKAPSGNINGSYNRAWKIKSYCGTLNVCNVIKITDDENVSKLTPLECWLLMGFKKNDYMKAKKVIKSKNELYKLAGNSIVINVIKEIINEIV